MAEPYRIGIICGSLAQAGTERYVYELCKGLNKTRFSADVLTIAPWGIGRQYYADPIRQSGIRIRPILPLFRWRSLPTRLRGLALKCQEIYYSRLLPRLLAYYDLLVVVHLDYLSDVDHMLPTDATIVLHLTTHLCQHASDYYHTKYPRNRSVFLVCMDGYQAQEATNGLGEAIRGYTVEPLPIDTSAFAQIKEWRSSTRPIIAYFIRLEPDREHMALLRAFAIVAKRSDAELRCYGRGDPSFLKAEAARLGIGDRVKCPGHVSDIRRTVIEDRVTLAWACAADDFMGYASIELSLWGVPTYFYNQVGSQSTETVLRRTGGAVHSYRRENDLAEASLAVLKDPARLREVGTGLRRYVQGLNDSRRVVGRIESFYEEVLQAKESECLSKRRAGKVA